MSTRKVVIEAAAAEICDWDNQYAWKSLGAESPMKASYEDAAERALTAAAPHIQAAALREFAETVRDFPGEDTLRNHIAALAITRADQLENGQS